MLSDDQRKFRAAEKREISHWRRETITISQAGFELVLLNFGDSSRSEKSAI